MCWRRIKGNKIFLLSWASPEEEFLVRLLEAGQETPPPQKPNSKKCHHVGGHVILSSMRKVHHHCFLHLV